MSNRGVVMTKALSVTLQVGAAILVPLLLLDSLLRHEGSSFVIVLVILGSTAFAVSRDLLSRSSQLRSRQPRSRQLQD